ncbi:cyclic-di-AMP receptor [Amedibacillus sp. YH-ame6]
MKLIMLVAGDEYADGITSILVDNNYYATNIGSSGDFLQYGHTVLLLGVKEEEVEKVMNLVKKKGQINSDDFDYRNEVMIHVLNIDDYVKIHKGIVE